MVSIRHSYSIKSVEYHDRNPLPATAFKADSGPILAVKSARALRRMTKAQLTLA
jgi:hypothetical protein